MKWPIEYYNFTKFHYILMKKIIPVLYQTHLTDGSSVREGEFGPSLIIEIAFPSVLTYLQFLLYSNAYVKYTNIIEQFDSHLCNQKR